MTGHKKLSLIEVIAKSPLFAEIVNKVELLAKLNRVVLEKLDPKLRGHCRVANLRDGILILTTTSPALGHQLRFATSDLLTSLRALPEWCHLKSIKIHVRLAYDAALPPSHPNPTPILSESNAEIIKASVQNINTAALKDALLRLSERASRPNRRPNFK